MKLLLDTHIWLWGHLDPAKLTPKVAAALVAPANELWLSPISVWEALVLIEKGRIKIRGDAVAWVDAAYSKLPMHEAMINREVAVRSRTVNVPHQDPADRFLAATAVAYDLTLVTADEHLVKGRGYRVLANR